MDANAAAVSVLTSLLQEKEKSVFAVAKITGIPQPTLARALRGANDITFGRVYAVLAAIEVDFAEFAERLAETMTDKPKKKKIVVKRDDLPKKKSVKR